MHSDDLQRILEARPNRLKAIAVSTADDGLTATAFNGLGALSERSNVFSVTKSILSMLYGIALADGVVPGLDERAIVDGPLVGDLLHMAGGFRRDPTDGTLPRFTRADHWVEACRVKQRDAPGSFLYSSANSQLLAEALTAGIREPLSTYAERRLLGPIGAVPVRSTGVVYDRIDATDEYSEVVWGTDPSGEQAGWSCLCLSIQDMIAIGRLALDDGVTPQGRLLPVGRLAANWTDTVLAIDPRGLDRG